MDYQDLLSYGNRSPHPSYWCYNCHVPLIQEICGLCGGKGVILSKNHFRPVFKEELSIIKKILNKGSLSQIQEELPLEIFSLPNLSLWAVRRTYFSRGQKVFTISGLTDGKPLLIKSHLSKRLLTKFRQSDLISLPYREIIKRLTRANLHALNRLEYEAVDFIEKAAKTFPERLPVVSFSGGKDSAVVSHLVRLALGPRVIHIFGDTTIEYPDTYNYIEKFKRNNPKIPFIKAKPARDFFELVKEIGPPSRILRWCCTTHKIGPLANLISTIDGNGVLSFVGNRKAESFMRKSYKAIEFKHKIAGEILVNPILDWQDTELWLYILTRGIEISSGYRKGFLRAGCLYCPFNTGWSEFIIGKNYKSHIRKWRGILSSYAAKINHPNCNNFVQEGWKVRAGGNGINSKLSEIGRVECDFQENSYNYTLKKDWTESFWEYLKPLGKIVKLYDDGIMANYYMSGPKGNNDIMVVMRVSRPRRHIKVTIIQEKDRRLLLQRLDRQILRFQACVLCGQCHSLCKANAFLPVESSRFEIDENICVNCLECARKPCFAIKSLRITGDKRWLYSQEPLGFNTLQGYFRKNNKDTGRGTSLRGLSQNNE